MVKTNIFLIGPTGAGKTTAGTLLAKALNFTFYDSDQEVARRAGMSIADIFAKEGEAGFRRREEQALAGLTALHPIVLATGAGAVLSAHNRELLAAGGRNVYLQISLANQQARLENDQDRPLLQNADWRKVLAAMHKERERFYKNMADFTLKVDSLEPMEVVNLIKKWLLC